MLESPHAVDDVDGSLTLAEFVDSLHEAARSGDTPFSPTTFPDSDPKGPGRITRTAFKIALALVLVAILVMTVKGLFTSQANHTAKAPALHLLNMTVPRVTLPPKPKPAHRAIKRAKKQRHSSSRPTKHQHSPTYTTSSMTAARHTPRQRATTPTRIQSRPAQQPAPTVATPAPDPAPTTPVAPPAPSAPEPNLDVCDPMNEFC